MIELPRPLDSFRYAMASVSMSSELSLLASALLQEARYTTMLSPEIIPIYADLRDFVIWQQINVHREQSMGDVQELELCATLILRLEYCLARFAFSNTFEEATAVQVICRIVVPIFVVQTQLFLWRHTATMRILVARLRGAMSCVGECEICHGRERSSSVETADMEGLWYGHPEVVLWAYLMGAFAASDVDQRSWFLFHCARGIRRYSGQIGMRLTWTSVSHMLKRMFYVDRLHGNDFCKLWEEVLLLADSVQL